MKAIGIQIKSTQAILVVLESDVNGVIVQTKESTKFDITDHTAPVQIRQFRDQINSAFDSVKPVKIGIVARNANAKGDRMPSPVSFKLEGVIQLYDKMDVQLVWKQTLIAYFKKNLKNLTSTHKYQEDAFDLAYYLLKK